MNKTEKIKLRRSEVALQTNYLWQCSQKICKMTIFGTKFSTCSNGPPSQLRCVGTLPPLHPVRAPVAAANWQTGQSSGSCGIINRWQQPSSTVSIFQWLAAKVLIAPVNKSTSRAVLYSILPWSNLPFASGLWATDDRKLN